MTEQTNQSSQTPTAYLVTAYLVTAYLVTAYLVTAYLVTAYLVTVDIAGHRYSTVVMNDSAENALLAGQKFLVDSREVDGIEDNDTGKIYGEWTALSAVGQLICGGLISTVVGFSYDYSYDYASRPEPDEPEENSGEYTGEYTGNRVYMQWYVRMEDEGPDDDFVPLAADIRSDRETDRENDIAF